MNDNGMAINWYIGDSLKNARFITPNDREIAVPSHIWDIELHAKSGDTIELIPFKNLIVAFPSDVRTFKDFLKFFNFCLHSTIHPESKLAKKRIAGFLSNKQVASLARKLQNGKLTWYDIIGDECAWAGNLKRSKQGKWTYNVDS